MLRISLTAQYLFGYSRLKFAMKKPRQNSTALRVILYLIFGVSTIIPIFCIIIIIPSYFRTQMNNENLENIDGNLMLISERILTYLSDIQQINGLAYSEPLFVNLLTQDTDTPQVIDLSHEKLFLNSIKVLKNDIKSIIVFAQNDNIVYFHRNVNAKLKTGYDFSSLMQHSTMEDINFIGAHNPDYFANDGRSMVFSMVRTIRQPYMEDSLGTILIDADSTMFENIFRSINMKEGIVSLLMDNAGQVLYSSRQVSDNVLSSIRQEQKKIDIGEIQYKVLQKNVPIGDWKIVVLVSDYAINRSMRLVYLVGILTSLITIIFTYVVFSFLSSHLLLKPIKDMALVLKQVEQGNLEVKFKSSYHNEITQLGENINRMISKLKILIDQEYKMAISQKQAEYRALQARIKPHFLYNTLNCLIGLNRLGDREKLENAIIDMTNMMRYSLSDSKHGMSTIRQEIEFISDYERLEKLRFEEKLDFTLEVDNRVYDAVIPKMLIQPLVENSILHNVEKSDEPVKVIVTVSYLANENKISIVIEDHGYGFDTEKENIVGTGLRNVQERIRYWNKDGSYTINSIIGKGTVIEILIPMLQDQSS